MTSKDPQQEPSSSEDPALARKRRIELRAKRVSDEDDDGEAAASSKRRRKEDASIVETQPLASIRGIKKHSRYVPEVPMTKEELSAWRKEARRVRNRESAAASRKKTRERIEELEEEVSVLQTKYATALARIVELENGSPASFTPDKLRQDILTTVSVSPANTPASTATVSPPLSPRESSFMLPTSMESFRDSNCDSHSHTGTLQHYHHHQQQQQQQPIDMISRPTAV